jgi:hypothetical protein
VTLVKTRGPARRVTFPHAGAGEGSLSNYRVVFIPDCLSSDSTLAQVAVLVRFVFQILRLDSAGRTLLRPMRSAPRCGGNEKDHHERKDEPMKLTTTTLVSVDGAAP